VPRAWTHCCRLPKSKGEGEVVKEHEIEEENKEDVEGDLEETQEEAEEEADEGEMLV